MVKQDILLVTVLNRAVRVPLAASEAAAAAVVVASKLVDMVVEVVVPVVNSATRVVDSDI